MIHTWQRPGYLSGRMWIAILFLLLPAFTARGAVAVSVPDKEHRIKAVFLYRFTQFVEWPAESFATATSPLVLQIVGPDPFGAYLDEVVQGEMVDSHPIIVKRAARLDDIVDCHVLFLSVPGAGDFEKRLANLKRRRILTVSDTKDFTQHGGMIHFFTLNGRIRLRVNMQAVRDADLNLSSKLLRLAEIASPSKG